MKDKYGGKIMKKYFRLRVKAYIYLKENNDEDKKQNVQNSAPQKENLNLKIINLFRNSSNWKWNKRLEENKIDVDCLKEDQKNSWKIVN